MTNETNDINGAEKNKGQQPRPEPTRPKQQPTPRASTPTNDNVVSKFNETKSNTKNGFWTFEIMITPILIQILFWIGLIACVGIGGMFIVDGMNSSWNRGEKLLIGIPLIIIGPLVVRMYCEFLILFFRMNKTLTEIKNKL
jgi:hypothetical protein